MRFYNYKLLNEMCDSFNEAITYTVKSGDNSVLKTCVELLCAIQANLESNRNSLKSESVFDVILNLSGEVTNYIGGAENSEKILELSEQLSEKIFSDVNYRLRVLFVAELGGKWDSMVSVYEEFKKRDDIDVDVVMQPIFRAVALPDGNTKTEFVYEDYLTPMGIKHILYNEYSIEKIKPDITFFSQPYESCTFPMFWPKNMCQHTKVVYLPYYAASTLCEWSVTRHGFFECETEKYSWKIACQSEIMKKYYQIYGSQKGKNVLATGLPKFDHIYNLSPDSVKCPDEWEKKLKNKKVFLWNTHFTIGERGTNIFEIGSKFLDIFESSKDRALIWRPHPMMETVVKVYSPNLYAQYLEFVKRIDESENMVMDRNSDYAYSFVYSDALISDLSSMADQYLLMDKPILFTTNLTPREASEKYYTIDKLHDFFKIPFSYSLSDTKEFIDKVCAGEDIWRGDREELKKTRLSMADGNSAKRLMNKLIEDYLDEFGVKRKGNQKDDKTALIIGNLKNSLPCIEHLNEKKIKYYICNDMLPDCDYPDEYECVSCFELDKINFDYVIITDRKYVNNIQELLISEYDISPDIIIPFWKMYYISIPNLVCDRVMMNPAHDSYEGIILGISHTEVGIIAEKLKRPFCNLAVSSQDIYYQLKTLEYCLEKYPEKLKNLKYAIIDLYDYKYFNYDTSLSTSAVKYLSYGGYDKDPHNFSKNKSVDFTYEEFKEYLVSEKYKGINNNVINICNELFKGIYKHTNYEGFSGNFDLNTRFKTVSDYDLENYRYDGGAANKIFEDTIAGNIENIRMLIETLKSVNENIKIYTIIIPKYIETEVRLTGRISKFVSKFNEIVDMLKEKYGVTMLDFHKLSDVSAKTSYYYDAAHLNYFGASWLTKQLNDIIFENE